ncbi:MAG: 4-alpha-glucanotransferase [Candidatus Bathyarchaeota archaeon]
MSTKHIHKLSSLSHLYGVQTAYYNVYGHRKKASQKSLLLVLRALGVNVKTLRDVPTAFRERKESLWKRCVEPVVVAWDRYTGAMNLRIPEDKASGYLTCHLKLETGKVKKLRYKVTHLPTFQTKNIEKTQYVTKRLTLPNLPLGYHTLGIEMQGNFFKTMIISAPLRAYPLPKKDSHKLWGIFIPLYALHSKKSWGAGNFSDLKELMLWLKRLGGSVVGMPPFLASFLDEPFDPSPYNPASRLFWNEFYLDINKIPELENCPTAQKLLKSKESHREIETMRSQSLIDYKKQMALKRRILEELAQYFFTKKLERYAALNRFTKTHPRLLDYASFRATCEKQRVPWPNWPQPTREGNIEPEDYEEKTMRYYLYVQWLANEQMDSLTKKARNLGVGLYLDVPLGVHPHSYDVWKNCDIFALDVSAGASPDAVFTNGQDWGFPPLHPERIREQNYRYFISCIRHQMAHTRLLRVDHVMGFHRLYWIPKRLTPREGVYVRYHADEFYAILSLESHRYKSLVIGENLGTVPSYVNRMMVKHNIQQMYVTQYELADNPNQALRAPPSASVASVNTHDMFPFAAFIKFLDIKERLRLGILTKQGAQRERRYRQYLNEALIVFLQNKGWLKNPATIKEILASCLRYISASRAKIILATLEDLWLETKPQNVPGVEKPSNWCRKAYFSFEEFSKKPEVLNILKEINNLRK